MLIHIALFRWKEGVSEDEVSEALTLVHAIKDKVGGVQDIFVGKNFHSENKGYTHGVVVIAENQQALDEYRSHPDHKQIAEKIEQMEADGIGFDFES